MIESKPWSRVKVPAKVSQIPNMLTAEERQYLIWLTAEEYRGWGAVVDLGPWLGCSSAALAQGLVDGGRGGVVQSYDLFRWSPQYMERYFPAGLAEGADFMPLFRQQTAAYAEFIRPEQMDLMAGRWSSRPIEILFVDAAKTLSLTNAILRVFASSLVPGKSLVVLQDFKHMPTYWIPLVFDGRPDLWEEVHDVRDGDTVTFRLRAPLDAASSSAASFDRYSFSAAQVRQVFQARLQRPGGDRLRPSFFRALLECDCGAEAESMLAGWLASASESDRRALEGQVEDARSSWRAGLVPVAWKALDAGQVDRAEQLLVAMNAPGDVYCQIALARVAQLRGNHPLALERLQLPLAQKPHPEASAILFAAISWTALRDHARSSQAVLTLLRERPGLGRGEKGWAVNVLRQNWDASGDVQVAKNDSRRLLEIEEGNPDALVVAAQLDLQLGDQGGAKQKLLRALQIDPAHAEAQAKLARL